MGVASLGATGGLHIPSAFVLGRAEAALSVGNDQDPRLGSFSHRRNYSLGFGLGGGLELFGRVADYQNAFDTVDNGFRINGPRDLSANVKWQLPLPARGWPAVAVGITDLSGGAVYFRSAYAVASDEWGRLRWSLGYARSQSIGQIGGLFGGAEVRLWESRATLMAETDGHRRHAGLRYYTDALPWLGGAQLVMSAQHAFGGAQTAGNPVPANTLNLSLLVPLSADGAVRDQRFRQRSADAPLAPVPRALPPADPPSAPDTASPGAGRLLGGLLTALRAAGLDRVSAAVLGDVLVVQFENHRYLHNEVDSLGVVLGLAAEQAPAGTARVAAISLKQGMPMVTVSVAIDAHRAWLRDEASAGAAAASMAVQLGPDAGDASLPWHEGSGQQVNRVRVSVKPLVNYAVATEYGIFDYSLAMQVRTTVPLWRGGLAYADWVEPVSHSDNMVPGRIFGDSRHRGGLQTLAVQQSWWVAPRVLASVGAGRYQFDAIGVEGEALIFAPWRNDTVYLRGRSLWRSDVGASTHEQAGSVGYRMRVSPATWAEGAVNRFTDGTSGPSAGVTRWFGDVSVQLFARQGGRNRYVGLEVSLPLAPRLGMAAAAVQATGSARFGLGLRSLLTTGGNAGNFVRPESARPLELNFRPEVEYLNSGRIDLPYLQSQLPRLRESFFSHGRAYLGQ